MLIGSSVHAQMQPTIETGSSTTDNIKLEIDHNVTTIKNLNNYSVTVTIHGTVETSLSLDKHEQKVIHMLPDAKFIEAQVNGSKCDCWVHLVTYCGTLPIIVSDIVFKKIGDQLQVSFDAYNSTPGNNTSFYLQYLSDNGWKLIKLDVPTVVGLKQHFIKSISIQ